MFSESQKESRSSLKNPLFYTSALLGVTVLAVAWILLSRWHENSEIERRAAKQRAEAQRESDRRAVEQLGGKDFAILNFYASPAAIRRGESTLLCYGVANVKSMRIEPGPFTASLWPSAARCIDVSPEKTTVFTLTIEDASGNSKSATAQIKVL